MSSDGTPSEYINIFKSDLESDWFRGLIKGIVTDIVKEELTFTTVDGESYNGGLTDSGSLYDKTVDLVVMWDEEKIAEVNLL